MTDAPRLAILIPAAGFSRRMGDRDKLLEEAYGLPILALTAARAFATSRDVIVTLPATDHPRAAALGATQPRVVAVPDAAEGMAASLRRGVAALPADTDAVMILPADMPDLHHAHLCRMRDHYATLPRGAILQATGEDGTPGHPVIFPSDLFSAFAQLTGDEGARSILKAHPDRLHRLALPGNKALTDLDTPEAWDAWRARHEP